MSDDPIKPDPARKPKRPRDANQLAKNVVDLATGQAEEEPKKQPTEPRGSAGGKARAEKMTPEQRSEIAKKAAEARWSESD